MNMLNHKHSQWIGAAALILSLPLYASAKSLTEEIDEVFNTVPGHNLVVSVDSGKVSITSGAGDKVRIHARMSVKGKNQEDADEAFKAVDRTVHQDGNTITVKFKQNRGKFPVLGFGRNRVQTAVTIVCPKDYNLKINTGSGNIEVSDIAGSLEFDTGSGNISGSMLSGKIMADTGSGNIVLKDVEGDVSGDTGSGNITVENIMGSLSGDTGSGNITGSGSIYQFNADTGSGGIHISSNVAITANSKADTGSGGVKIDLLADSAFSLKAHSGSGGVSCDFPLSNTVSIKKNRIDAEVNGGGPRILLDTGSGGIRLRAIK